MRDFARLKQDPCVQGRRSRHFLVPQVKLRIFIYIYIYFWHAAFPNNNCLRYVSSAAAPTAHTHSHVASQVVDGLYGAFIVEDDVPDGATEQCFPPNATTSSGAVCVPTDKLQELNVVLSDWWTKDSRTQDAGLGRVKFAWIGALLKLCSLLCYTCQYTVLCMVCCKCMQTVLCCTTGWWCDA
jgi:hypothetical protein